MTVSFAGAMLKVKRACQHIDELERWLADLVKSDADAARAYKNAGGLQDAQVVVQRHGGKFTNPSPIVGDAVHNLRAAFDHAAYAIVSLTAAAPREIFFPMNETREALINTREYRAIEAVSLDFARVIADVIKPYKTGGRYEIWALNQLDRIDKHRFLVDTITHSTYLDIVLREEQEDDPPRRGPGVIFAIGVETVRADGSRVSETRVPLAGTKAYIHNQSAGYPAVEIKFGKGMPFEHEPVIPTLKQLAELVRSSIEVLAA